MGVFSLIRGSSAFCFSLKSYLFFTDLEQESVLDVLDAARKDCPRYLKTKSSCFIQVLVSSM